MIPPREMATPTQAAAKNAGNRRPRPPVWRRRLGYRQVMLYCLLLLFVAGLHSAGLFERWSQPAVAAAGGAAASERAIADQDGDAPANEVNAAGTSGSQASKQHAAGTHADSEHTGGGHSDPVAPVLLAVALILFAAKVGGDLFERVGLPAVLGELTVGILLGNLGLLTGWQGLEYLKPPPPDALLHPYEVGAMIKMLASIGVVLLLFEVGLESTVSEMMSVGLSSFLAAVNGVIAPMILGWGLSALMIPDEGWQVHMFIGATLCATSVGITARVLRDLGRHQQREAQIILGAAVIDDVLGLLVLAVVSGIITSGSVDTASLLILIGKAFGFLVGAILLGQRLLTRPLFLAASFLRGHGLLIVTALTICFGFAYLANLVGLAPIVGAFAAGLILEKTQYAELGQDEGHELEELLHPITALLVPIFFVDMGIQVDLQSFQDPSAWGFAAALTVVAILGKQVCALGVLEKGLNRTAVGLGMIPRGEVGLIFADVGRHLIVDGHRVISNSTFSAVVVMVMVTTMVTPPFLKWSLGRTPPPADSGDASSDDSRTERPNAIPALSQERTLAGDCPGEAHGEDES